MPENAPARLDNYALEGYGPGSKCIEQGHEWLAKKGLLTRTMVDWGSGCYKYHCDGGLQVEVGGEFYTCHRKGQHLEIFGSLNDWKINGSLVCPSCEEFCGVQKGCPQEIMSDTEGIVFVEGKTSSHRNNAGILRISFVELFYFIILRVVLMACVVPGFQVINIVT